MLNVYFLVAFSALGNLAKEKSRSASSALRVCPCRVSWSARLVRGFKGPPPHRQKILRAPPSAHPLFSLVYQRLWFRNYFYVSQCSKAAVSPYRRTREISQIDEAQHTRRQYCRLEWKPRPRGSSSYAISIFAIVKKRLRHSKPPTRAHTHPQRILIKAPSLCVGSIDPIYPVFEIDDCAFIRFRMRVHAFCLYIN